MEAAALAMFMISAGGFTALLESPRSEVSRFVVDPLLRRSLIGAAMGSTAIALIYCPWGKRSGAHMNPAITLTYLQLGKIPPWDAFYYSWFQLGGGLAGVLITAAALGKAFTAPPVNYVVTVPGPAGPLAALAGEVLIAAAIMLMILMVSNSRRGARYTGLLAGLMIAGYVTLESPLSGFGMNPARTLASALPSGIFTALWIYLLAPCVGMLGAARIFRLVRGQNSVRCCKLHHSATERCIYCGHVGWPPRPSVAG
jgi:aquaporin Z